MIILHHGVEWSHSQKLKRERKNEMEIKEDGKMLKEKPRNVGRKEG